jgi:hypothetical protein
MTTMYRTFAGNRGPLAAYWGMSGFEPTDYSVVVKNRGNPPDPWRWEIYRAGRSSAIKQSSVYFNTMAMASRAGKEALKGLLEKLYA